MNPPTHDDTGLLQNLFDSIRTSHADAAAFFRGLGTWFARFQSLETRSRTHAYRVSRIEKQLCGLATIRYRGVWSGEAHRRGEVVTRDGSLWMCDADQTEAAPGTNSPDWKLVAKKGRDGKDGARGPAGPPGPPPTHEWNASGTRLRFEQPGSHGTSEWGQWSEDLKGPIGPPGRDGRGGGVIVQNAHSYFPAGW